MDPSFILVGLLGLGLGAAVDHLAVILLPLALTGG